MKVTKQGKRVCPVFDIHANAASSRHDYKDIGKELDLCAQMGFDRVYAVVAPDGCPMMSSPWLQPSTPERLTGNALIETVMAVGDTAFAYAYEAHKRGLEIFAVYKPYEGGGGMTVPHGAKAAYDYGRREDIGGDRIGFETFAADHPEYVTRRFPIKDYTARLNQSATSVEITFVLDRLEQRVPARGKYTVYREREPDEYSVSEHAAEINLFVSRDNGDYKQWAARGVKRDYLLRTDISDCNGKIVLKNALCRRIEVKDLMIPPEYKYIAFTVDGCSMYTLPYSMIKLYGDKGEIPITVGSHARVRNSQDDTETVLASERVWGAENMPRQCTGSAQEAQNAFEHNGFEFDWHGQGFAGDGFMRCSAYCIARGKIQLLKGNLCEGYPEVREHWLENIRRLLAKGFDGIDIRLQAHSSMICDYSEFGGNEPLVSRYESIYGRLKPFERPDTIKMMRVRGDFYCDFVDEAAKIIHEAGRKLAVHVRHCFEEPVDSADFNELGFWVMPKILPDYKRLIDAADEVVLKEYFFNEYRTETAAVMKRYAAQQGKRFFINLYIAQCGELNEKFFDEVCRDELVGGILLYEVGDPDSGGGHDLLNVPAPGLISLRNGIRPYVPAVKKLKELLAQNDFLDDGR